MIKHARRVHRVVTITCWLVAPVATLRSTVGWYLVKKTWWGISRLTKDRTIIPGTLQCGPSSIASRLS